MFGKGDDIVLSLVDGDDVVIILFVNGGGSGDGVNLDDFVDDGGVFTITFFVDAVGDINDDVDIFVPVIFVGDNECNDDLNVDNFDNVEVVFINLEILL